MTFFGSFIFYSYPIIIGCYSNEAGGGCTEGFMDLSLLVAKAATPVGSLADNTLADSNEGRWIINSNTFRCINVSVTEIFLELISDQNMVIGTNILALRYGSMTMLIYFIINLKLFLLYCLLIISLPMDHIVLLFLVLLVLIAAITTLLDLVLRSQIIHSQMTVGWGMVWLRETTYMQHH